MSTTVLTPVMSHISRVPVEHLSSIFIMCDAERHDEMPDLKWAPLCLLLVCSEWKRIALRTAALWNHLHVDFYDSALKKHTSLINTWISRSGNLPLALSFNMSSVKISSEPLMALLGLTWRLKVLRLRLNEGQRTFLYILQMRQMPLLESMELCINESRLLTWANTGGIDLNHFCPALRALLLRQGAYFYILDAPWSQLSTLRIPYEELEFTDAYNLMKKCSSLVECSLFIAPSHDLMDFGGSGPLILLPLLQILSIRSYGENTGDFLQHFTLPSLKSLYLEPELIDCPKYDHQFPVKLYQFQQQSGAHLEDLSLDGFDLTHEAFFDFLAINPSLSYLRVFGCKIFMEEFCKTMLVSPDSTTNILPNMVVLDIQFFEQSTKDHQLLDVLESRFKPQNSSSHVGVPVKKLKNVSVQLRDDMEDD
ncbi:hypothetical protein BDQ12DRAFT_738757, partial [Crucibulum laeve]